MNLPVASRRPDRGGVDRAFASSPWRRSGFRWFFTGQLVSLIGTSLTPVALAFAVLEASGRSRDLALVLAAQSLPMLGFLLIGGAVADRASRSAVLVISHVGAALTQAAVAGLLISGSYHLGAVVALEALNGTFAAFTIPALRGIIPQLVHSTALQRANAARATARSATRILGPTVAGLLVVTVGGGWAMAVAATTYSIAAICMARLKLPPVTPTAAKATLIADIRDGWSEFRALPWVVVVVTVFASTNFILAGVWLVLGPVIARESVGEAAWGMVLSARAVGLLIMGIVMYRLVVTHLLRLGQLCAALVAVPFVLLGLDVSAVWLIFAALIAGLGAAVTGVAWETSIQEHVPAHALSRVSSYDELGSFIAVPLGQLAVVPVAAAFGEHRVAVVGGVLYILLTLVALAFPSVRNLRHATGRR
ncbi:MAG TPA: MFS transporter [Micromonosporaceae bacterium]|nr:MFS transporter [Micromonosporaceae bacterium]